MSLAQDSAQMARDGGVTTPKLGNNAFSTDKLFQIGQGQFIGRDNLQSGTGNVAATQSYPDISLTSALSAPFDATTAWRGLSAYISQIKQTNTSSLNAFYSEIINSQNLFGSTKYAGNIIHPNGKVYLLPNASTNLGILNPSNMSITTLAPGIPAGYNTYPYSGGVLAQDGKIYLVPSQTTYIVEIDPSNNGFTSYAGPTHTTAQSMFVAGGTLAPNGKIYFFPGSITFCGIFDPTLKTYTAFSINPPVGTIGAGVSLYNGNALAPNGKIYGIPEEATMVLVIDPSTNTASTFGNYPGTGNWPSLTDKYYGGVLAPNGKIYCIPGAATVVACIDPNNNSVTTFGMAGGVGLGLGTTLLKFIDGVLASNGKIYGVPYNASYVLIIDPDNDTCTTFSDSLIGSGYVGNGGCSLPNGKIFFVPWNSSNPVCLNILTNNNLGINVTSSPFINKY